MLINGFNEAYKNTASNYLKVLNDPTSDIHFWTTKKGNLPDLYYISPYTEPPGTEFKTVPLYVTGALLFKEIQIGKEGNKNIKYHLELAEMSAFKNWTK